MFELRAICCYTYVRVAGVGDGVRVTLDPPSLAEIDKVVLPCLPSLVRSANCKTYSISRKDLDNRIWNVASVSPEHQSESHDYGEPVESGRRVEVVPGGQELVAVEVEKCAEEDGSEDVGVLTSKSDKLIKIGIEVDLLTLNISYQRLRSGVQEAKHSHANGTSIAMPLQ